MALEFYVIPDLREFTLEQLKDFLTVYLRQIQGVGKDTSQHSEFSAKDGHTPGVGSHTHAATVAEGGKLLNYYHVDGSNPITGALDHDGLTVGLYAKTPVAQAAAAANLTDNSGGTANDTVQALTDPADAPATPDALRDDLVANLIPELRNNFADLATKVNKALTVLRNIGAMAT